MITMGKVRIAKSDIKLIAPAAMKVKSVFIHLPSMFGFEILARGTYANINKKKR